MAALQAWSGWRQYRRLADEWRNIVMYSESGQDWHYFEPLTAVLNDELQRRVTYVTSDAADPGLAREHPLFRAICLPEGFFLTLHFNLQRADVVVLTMMDLDKLQLKKSINPVHYVYLFHALGSTHMVDHANSYDAYDSLFCAGPHHVRELRRREEMQGMQPRNLFAYGHPRLEQLLEAGRAYARRAAAPAPGEPPVVLIAPTWGEHSIFNACGEELTGALLDAGYRVIARPHYQTVKRTPEVIERLKTRFAGHERLEFQLRMGESESLFRSDVLICDWSATSIEYALGLEKPVLFIDLPRRVRNPAWRELGIEPLEASFRERAGAVVAPDRLQEVPDAIRGLLARRDEFRRTMQGLRDELVFNVGRSVALGAREIARLADAMAREREQREQAHG